ncbi:hypothetical protein M3F59_04335, partial [Brachybacterium muris]|uniref:hypothetical protein n=1 Tax=Brachybacterium muris TaxID=219301 RepID=UPI00223B4DE1
MTHRNAPLTVLGRQRAVTEVLGMGFVGLALTFLGGFALLIWISGVDILFSRDLLVVLLMVAEVLSLGIFAWAIFEVRRGVFAVTTEGLVVTPHLRRSRFVPWAHVSRLEISDAPMAAGSVVVVTTTKTCITASRTTGP